MGRAKRNEVSEIERTDFNGVIFDSVKDMCIYHNVSIMTYYGRRNRGMTVSEALLSNKSRNGSVDKRTDHTGRTFNTITEMIKFWGREPEAYYQAIRDGRSIEEALTGIYKLSKGSTIEDRTDHLGNVYRTKKDMCKAYGITHGTYFHRIHDSGWDKERALTTPTRQPKLEYDGKVFKNEHELCEYLDISYNQYTNHKLRYKCDYRTTIQHILDGKVKSWTRPEKDRTDIDGNVYPSLRKLCEARNLDYMLVQFMLDRGYSMQEIENTDGWDSLSTPQKENRKITDPFGRDFKDKKELSEYYKIPYAVLQSRLNRGWSIEEAIELKPRNTHQSRKYYRSIKIMKSVYHKGKLEYFICLLDGKEEVLSGKEILEFNSIKREDKKVSIG